MYIHHLCTTVLIALQKHIPNSIVSQKQNLPHNPQRHLLGEEGEEEQELGGGGGEEGEGGEGEEERAEEHRRQLHRVTIVHVHVLHMCTCTYI